MVYAIAQRLTSSHNQQVENLGRRASYTDQMEAVRSHLRDGASSLDPTTPWTRCD